MKSAVRRQNVERQLLKSVWTRRCAQLGDRTGLIVSFAVAVAFTSMAVGADVNQYTLYNGTSPNGRYFVATTRGIDKTDGDEIPEVLFSVRDKKTGTVVGQLDSILQLHEPDNFTADIHLVWSVDSSRLAVFADLSHYHSFLSAYAINGKSVKKLKLPDNPGYSAACKAINWDPSEHENHFSWDTFDADSVKWESDNDLSAEVSYSIEDTGVTMMGDFVRAKSGWVFWVKKIEINP
jgi:hypothetical protein